MGAGPRVVIGRIRYLFHRLWPLLWATGWRRFLRLLAHDFRMPDGSPAVPAAIPGLKRSWLKLHLHWRQFCAGAEVTNFRRALVLLVALGDRTDLRHRSCPIRCATSGADALVGSRLIETALYALAPSDGGVRRSVLDDIVDDDPFWAAACLLLGELLLEDGDFEGARRQAKSAMVLTSTAPAASHLLYRASRSLGGAVGDAAIEGICLDDLSDRFCPEPFQTIVTSAPKPDQNPIVYGCHCGAWLPVDFAQGRAGADFQEIWNGAAAQEVRRSILDGDFKYCNRELCSHMKLGTLPRKSEVQDPVFRDIIDTKKTILETGPRAVQLSHDPSCNLACPSCRASLILARSSDTDRMWDFHERITKPLLRQTCGTLNITGYGDPFGSKHYRRILEELNPIDYPELNISLVTNAQLLTHRQWDALDNIHPMVKSINISIDAAKRETYEIVRRPAKWSILLENLGFLRDLRRKGSDWLLLFSFVVQAINYREMPIFVELGESFEADLIIFQRFFNMGSLTGEQFKTNDIADPEHPEHREYLRTLADERMQHPIVCVYNASL